MTKTTNQRRTAASLVEDIRKRLVAEQQVFSLAREAVAQSEARLVTIQSILDEVDTNRGDDDE